MSYKLDYLSQGPEELRRSFFENCISEISYIWIEFEPRISYLIDEIKKHRISPNSLADFESIPSEIENLVKNDMGNYLQNIHSKSIPTIRANEKTIFNQVMLVKEPEIFGNLIYGIMGGEQYDKRNPNLTSMYDNFIKFEINLRYPEYNAWESTSSSQLTRIRLTKLADFSLQNKQEILDVLKKIYQRNKKSEKLQRQITSAVNANDVSEADKLHVELFNHEKRDVWRMPFKDELGIVYSQNCAHSIQGFANNVRHGNDSRQRIIRDEQNRAIKDPITGANSIGGINVVRNNFTDLLYSIEEILRIHKTSLPDI